MIDFSLNPNKSELNQNVELILQQIDLLFDTNINEVLGYEDFGSQYDRYLYDLQISNEGLKQKVLSDLNSLELFEYKPTVNVYLLQGTEQDIALINIILKSDTDKIEKTYKIS
jgi:hypothetical protein